MTYIKLGTLGWEDVTTTEQLSGRTIDGTASYVKLVKRAGTTGTGDLAFAHGITGMTRLVSIFVGVEDAVPQWFTFPMGTISSTPNNWGLGVSVDGTNITLHIGASWTSTNALRDVYAILEYLK